MTSWAIVAIPEDGESVWKTSSEKVPHLTLLFLGEQSDPQKAIHIAEYLNHAANTSINKFGLNVRNRGVLGDEQADVLFFENAKFQDNMKRVQDFRANLLADSVIYEAYSSVEQFPGWTPHLTLGYPGRPAKKGEGIDSLPPYAVYFDKIALWVDDFDGPTFELDYRDAQSMAMDSLAHRNALRSKAHKIPETSRDVVMRNVIARQKLREPSNLKHLGVGARKVEYKNPIEDAVARTLAAAASTSAELSTEGRFLKHAIAGDLRHGSTAESKKVYVRENQLSFLRHFEDAVGGSPSERAGREFDLTTRPDGDWILSSINRIAHTGTVETHIRPKLDNNGMIVNYEIIHDQMSNEDLSLALKHYGVKGMKWGVRRQSPESSGSGGDAGPGTKNASSKSAAERRADKKAAKAFERQAKFKKPKASEEAEAVAVGRKRANAHGTDMMTNKELQSMITRMNLEQQYATLRSSEKAASARNSGRKYFSDVLKDVGDQLIREAVKTAATEAGKAMFKEATTSDSRTRTYVRSEQQRRRQRQLGASPVRQLPPPRR